MIRDCPARLQQSTMSESPQNRPPQGPGSRGPNDPPGFNWRLAILLGVAFLILGLAFLQSPMSASSQQMTYAQFKKAWDQGLVITDDPKHALEVTTGDSPYNAVIHGFLATKPPRATTGLRCP